MTKISLYLSILLLSILTISCSDDSPVDGGGGNETEDPSASAQYIITSSPSAFDGVADYLLIAESLTEGSVTTVGSGIEQDGTFRYYITNDNKLYSLLYGQGNPGAVTAYELNGKGDLEQLVDFQSESMHAFTKVNDEILMMKAPRSINDPTAFWYRLDTENSQFVDEGQINVFELAGNGEGAFPSWLTQVNDQVFMPFFSISGQGNNSFSTSYPDSAWVAVYSYPEMELQTVIKDDRTSFIGRYFTKGLSVDENGDVYAFSSAIAVNDMSEMISTKSSAITRINSGTTTFDQDYFFNVEEASGGFYLTDHVYVSGGNVLLMMSPVEEKAAYSTGQNLAIVNVYDQSFSWVDGLPDASKVTNVTGSISSYVSEDGNTVYAGITTEDGSYVYAIDVASATATQGLKVEGGTITSINKLEPVE